MNFYKKAMMAEGGEMPEYGQGGKMPQYQEGGMMQKGAEQLQMLKQAYDKAVEEKDMEMLGQIEAALKDIFDSTKDPQARELLGKMFPEMEFMVDDEADMRREMESRRPSVQQMMAAGGKLKMVKNDDGEMVPFYAADGIGRMMAGGAFGKKKKEMTYPGGGYVMMK